MPFSTDKIMLPIGSVVTVIGLSLSIYAVWYDAASAAEQASAGVESLGKRLTALELDVRALQINEARDQQIGQDQAKTLHRIEKNLDRLLEKLEP